MNPKETTIYTRGSNIPQVILKQTADPDDEVDITNVNDLTYEGPVLVGSNGDSGFVIYDTGSAWFTITTAVCATCPT